jgi:hypothetical protein
VQGNGFSALHLLFAHLEAGRKCKSLEEPGWRFGKIQGYNKIIREGFCREAEPSAKLEFVS